MEDELAAYCLNKAVFLFGTSVEREIREATEGKKPKQADAIAQNVVARWLGKPMKFRTPEPTQRR